MSKKNKNVLKLINIPKDLTYDELRAILSRVGYEEITKGKTSGSAVMFVNKKEEKIFIHKPHPGNIVKPVYIREIVKTLIERGEI